MDLLKSVYNNIANGDYRFCGKFAWDIYNGALEGENFETDGMKIIAEYL